MSAGKPVVTGGGEGPPAALAVRNVSKTFGSRRVLDQFELELQPGEIHGLIGQNGSGKSTLIKILTGYHSADAGAEFSIVGERHTASWRGHDLIRVVHQDLALNHDASVVENVCVNSFPRRPRTGRLVVDWRAAAERTRRALAPFNPDIRPDMPLGDLEPTDRAFVAIARATENLIGSGHGVLILDEPTAYLPLDGVTKLFDRLRHVASSGVAVLFVSHDLGEVLELTDRVTVLRDGVIRFSGATRTTDHDELVRHIVGRGLETVPSQGRPPTPLDRDPVLTVTGLRTRGARLPDFRLRPGEIVGFTGLLGSGFSRPLYALFGGDQYVEAGRATLNNEDLECTELTPREMIRRGLGMIPSDRPGMSSAQTLTTRENLTLLTLRRYAGRGGVIRGSAESRATRELLLDYGVEPPHPGVALSSLSGGNQQKLILGKWIETRPDVLLIHEPTQGVDVGARQEIYARLRSVAAEGTGVVIASATYEELPAICDRVLVFRRGDVVKELTGDFDHEAITMHCFAPATPS